MDIKTDVFINQLAQGIKPIGLGIEWFSNSSESTQFEVLKRLAYLIIQSQAVGKDAETAISLSGLKSTYTPCRLLMDVQNNEPEGNLKLRVTLSKICELPTSERLKSFKLLISLFSVAEGRQRSKGLNPDKYWWHRDLSDEIVVSTILNEGT